MNALVHSRVWLLLGWSMIHFLWVGALLLIAVGALRLLLRRASPSVRYAVALLGFVSLAAAPAVVATKLAPRSLAAFETSPPVVPDPKLDIPVPKIGSLDEARQPLASTKAIATPAADPALDLAAISAMARRTGRVGAAYLPWLWLAGFPFMAIYLLAGISGTGRLRRRATLATEPALLSMLERLAGELAVRGRAVIGLSAQVVAPIVVGIARPIIMLPPALLADWNSEELELILLHELAHVRRWDNLVNLFQRVVEAVLFFHPAVWIVSRWVRLEREQCCDEIVLAHRDAPQKYAETLAALAVPGISPVHAAAAMANHQLVARIRNILNVEDRTMRFSTRSVLVAIASIGLLVSLLFIAAPLAADDEQKPSGEVDRHALARRIALDLTGMPPSQQDVMQFVDDKSPEAYKTYVDHLLAAAPDNKDAAHQWIADVQWSNVKLQKRPWGYEQACGPPDTNQPGDFPTAWASASPDGQREWLDVMFGEKIDGVALVVYESNAPGAIDRLWLLDEQGKTTEKHDVKDPTPTTAASGVSIFPLVAVTHGVRIELDSERVAGWNEIDAVGLLDKKGQIHWATSAKGSSTFADVIDQSQVYPAHDLVVSKFVDDSSGSQSAVISDQDFGSDPEVMKLRANIQELEQAAHQRIERLRTERAAAQAQEVQTKAVFGQTRLAAQQALAAEAQAAQAQEKIVAERAAAQAQLQAANDNVRRLQDELAAVRKEAEKLHYVKELDEVKLKDDLKAKADQGRIGDRVELRLDVESLVNAKERLGDVASQLGNELKQLDLQLEQSPQSARGEVVARANKLRDELAGIEATIKQLDKSLADESTRAVARQDSIRDKAAAAAREDREALERIERLEKAVQELRRAQQGNQPPTSTSGASSIFAPMRVQRGSQQQPATTPQGR
ncbi:MAG TPA: M56 family metallopeptidase [Pirellulales bacterium]|nr:M56 family metallopeptidase [Pirellulales bacterium]